MAEKYPSRARLAAPKARALSPRSPEIRRRFGVDTAALRRISTPREDAEWINFLGTLSVEQIGRLPYECLDVDVLQATPEMLHNIPRPELESYVAEGLANDPKKTIRKGLAFTSYEQDDHGVTSTLHECSIGREWTVRSHHLIACDGAKSIVRSALGIPFVGENSYETTKASGAGSAFSNFRRRSCDHHL